MSQYLKRIEDAIRQEPDPFRRAELRSRRALYLARVSRFGEAQGEIDSLRQDFGNGQSGRVTCLLMIAEGVKAHYESFAAVASDRLGRALFLGQAMRDNEVVAMAAAWKGFLDFEYSRFESMARSLMLSADSWSPEEHTSKTRVFLMLMVASLVLGRVEAAQRYFKVAHSHAIADGDQASIEALVFDKAAHSLSRQRVEWATGVVNPEWAARTKLDLESSKNLNRLVNIDTMVDHVHLALARTEWLIGEFSGAAIALERFVGSKSFPSSHLNDSALRTELAYCHLMSGDHSRAHSFATLIDLDELRALDPDERVVLTKMLLALDGAGLPVLGAATLADFARDAAHDHAEFERRLGEAMALVQSRLPESTA